MKLTAFVVSFILITTSTILATDTPPRGTPGHMQPSGPYLNAVYLLELENGWHDQENRLIEDDKSNQYFFQHYKNTKQQPLQKIACYWINHEIVEEIATLGPFPSIQYSCYWNTGNPKKLPEFFIKGQKDSIVSYSKSNEPYSKGFYNLTIKEYNLHDKFDISDTLHSFYFGDLDKDRFFELVCADLSWKDEFTEYGCPSSLRIFKSDENGKFTENTSKFQPVTDKWDSDLEQFARESFDNHRILACINLAMSLKNHGKTNFMSKVELIMSNPKGYLSGKVPSAVARVIEKLKTLTNEPK